MALRSLVGKLRRLPLRTADPAPAKDLQRSQKSWKLTDPTEFDSIGMQARAISAKIDEEMTRDREEVLRRIKLYDRLTMLAAAFGFGTALFVVSCVAEVILEVD